MMVASRPAQSCVFRICVFTDKRVWIPAQQGRLWGEENSWEKGSVLMYVHMYQDPSLRDHAAVRDKDG